MKAFDAVCQAQPRALPSSSGIALVVQPQADRVAE